MTSNIKGPEGPRSPQPRGPVFGQEAGANLSLRIGQILLQRASGQSPTLVGKSGDATDPPAGGLHAGKRDERLRDFASRIEGQRTRASEEIEAGQTGLAALLGKLLGDPDSVAEKGIAGSLREALPKGLALPTAPVGRHTDLRSLTGDAVQEFSRQIGDFVDTLLGDGGEGVLEGCLDPGLRDALRHEASDIARRNPGDQSTQQVRAHCLDVLILRSVLPALAREGVDIRALVHVATGNTNGLSPDLANALGPVVDRFATRFDDLLRKLEIPGIGQ